MTMRCVDCSGPATIQVLSPEGWPMGTFCAGCWAEQVAFADRVRLLLRAGYDELTTTPASEVPATLRG